MQLDSVDLTLWLAGIAAEVALVGLALWRRWFRSMPFFFAYLLFDLLAEGAGWLSLQQGMNFYTRVYMGILVLNLVLELAVLAEVSRTVLKLNHRKAPRLALSVLLVALTSLLLWTLGPWHGIGGLDSLSGILEHMRQTSIVVRLATVLSMAWMSHLLELHWPEQQLRIVTGLGLMALVGLLNMLVQSWITVPHWVRRMDQAEIASYLGVSFYWVLTMGLNVEKP